MAAADSALPPLVLASTSRYRRELLGRLVTGFECVAPGVDEQPRPGEAPATLASRLARAKAQAGAAQRPETVVIGSDQVAAVAGRTLGKPGSFPRAAEQLRASAGRTLDLYTAVCVTGPSSAQELEYLDHIRVQFRALSEPEIKRYLEREQPYDCAGSFKAEGLGITLMEAIHSTDPTSIQGLPLIWLAGALRSRGWALP